MICYSSDLMIYKGLSKSYLEDYNSVKELYNYNFKDENDLLKRVSKLDNTNFDRESLHKALVEINEQFTCSVKTKDNIDSIKNDDTLVVVTGQQAGIFTGACYTIYKAITTIKLAKETSDKLGRRVVPIFWIASEDHDFEEIRQLNYVVNGKIKNLKIDKKPDSETTTKDKFNYSFLKESIGDIQVNKSVYDSIEGFINDVSDHSDVELLEKLLKSTITEKESLANWFGKIMAKLFYDYGLVFLDPMNKTIREMESPFFEKVINSQDEINEAFLNNTNKVIEMGHKPMIDFEESALGLFTYYGGERLMIKKAGEDEYNLESQDVIVTLTKAEVIKISKENPVALSTNVVLRPIVQDIILPTIAYIAGPGEMQYYSQLSSVYSVFDMEMPIIYPRENFTLVPKEITGILEELDVSEDDFILFGLDKIKSMLLEKNDDIQIDNSFDEFSIKFNGEYSELIEKILEISPDIKPLADKNIRLINNQVKYLREKAHRFHRRNNKDLLEDLKFVENNITPFGNLQEREFSIINYINNDNKDLLEYIINDLEIDYKHRIIKMGI